MSEFRFAEPQWVHLLWGVALFVAALLLLERRGRGALTELLGPVLCERLVQAPATWRRIARIALLGLAGACLVLALMRPQAGLRQVATPQVGAELMIALDVSRSMLAEDAVPNRLARAKAEIIDLLGYLDGDQVGLVAFAGRASVLCPLTPDFGFLRLVLETVGPGSVTRGGTRLAEPIYKAIEGFGEPSGASRAILLITDGEDHDSFALDAARAAAEAGVRILAIGFGDESGSEIYVTNPRTGARELVRDADGNPVRSRLDGDLLREIALATGGAYVPAATGTLDLESIYETHIAALFRGALDTRGRTVRDEVYGWFLLAALVFLIASAGIAAGPATLLLLGVVLLPSQPLRAQPPAAPLPQAQEGAVAAAQPESAARAESAAPATPRERYNAGVGALESGDLEEAQRQLERAHSEAGDDAELRFRARYDVGFLLVQRAGRTEAEQPDAALADLQRAADWFREAVALRPEHEDARVNLEVALRRALLLADRLARQREAGLESELEALATRQRATADGVVRLLALSAADPSPDAGDRLRDEYRNAATSERVLLSDADALAARTDASQAALEARDAEELSPEEAARKAQQEGVLHYLHRARERMAQARRQLRERQGQRAYRRASAAVAELERAIDQLRDPVRVLDRLLRLQAELAAETELLVADAGGALGAEAAVRPAWLDRERTAADQASLAERVMELGVRLRAGLQAEPAADADPQAAARLAAVSEATPLLEEALGELRTAYTALDPDGVLERAPPAQRAAVELLAAARERFADLKGLIEVAFLEQERIAALLETASREVLREAVVPLREAQARNLERSDRLADKLELERQQRVGRENAEQDEAALERLALAQDLLPSLRGAMRDAADALGPPDAAASRARFEPAAAAASDALAKLEMLRRLFASITEQLREIADRQLALQDATRDAEASVAASTASGSAARPQPDSAPEELLERQGGLAERTLGLADALAEQSSQVAAAPDGAAAEGAAALRLAAEHVLGAEGAMRASEQALEAAPPAFASARERQAEALEELAKALELLEPERPSDPEAPQREQRPSPPAAGEEPPSADAQPQPQPESGADPGQLLQGVRDREAQRRRERERERSGGVPEDTVEKDW